MLKNSIKIEIIHVIIFTKRKDLSLLFNNLRLFLKCTVLVKWKQSAKSNFFQKICDYGSVYFFLISSQMVVLWTCATWWRPPPDFIRFHKEINLPLKSKKSEWFEKLLGFARSHSIKTNGSVSLLRYHTTPFLLVLIFTVEYFFEIKKNA